MNKNKLIVYATLAGGEMIKLNRKFKIPYDEYLYRQIREKAVDSGKIWSEIVHCENANNQQNTEREIYKITQKMNRSHSLHSQSVQAVAQNYFAVRKATKEKIKNGDTKVKHPWKEKKFYKIPYKKKGMEIQKNTIFLKHYEYEVDVRNPDKKPRRLQDYIEIPNKAREDISNISYAEIVYCNGNYYFHYVKEIKEKEPNKLFKPAGCDLGEIHCIAVASEDKALVISGRAIRALQQYRNKELAELSRKMSRCTKDSIKWLKYKRAFNKVKLIIRQRVDDLVHKATKMAVDFLIKENVSHIVIGDPKGIEKGTKWDPSKRVKVNKKRRQPLSQWLYGEFKYKLEYKCKLNGIQVYFVSEEYTSRDCPFCKGRHYTENRIYICPNAKKEIHRDVNGAQNICRKKYPLQVRQLEVIHKQPVWYKKYLPM